MTDRTDTRIAILVTDYGVEESELAVPRAAVAEAGWRAVIVSTGGRTIRSLVGDRDPGETFTADSILGRADPRGFDGLIIPGGTVNADRLRSTAAAVGFVRDFAETGRPIAAICHAPWILIEAGLVAAAQLTSYPSLQTDIRNAGGDWRDEPVVVHDGEEVTLITSRSPADLTAFTSALLDEIPGSPEPVP